MGLEECYSFFFFQLKALTYVICFRKERKLLVVSKYRDYEFSDRKFSDRKSSDFQRIFFSVTENLVTTSMVSNMSERNFSD